MSQLRPRPAPADPIIRASDVGLYLFCHRAWWYRVVHGLQSSNVRELAAGEENHLRHSQKVRWSTQLQAAAYVAVTFAALLLALGVINLVVNSR